MIWAPCFLFALLHSFLLYYRILDCFFILDDFVWLDCARQAQRDISQVFGLEISNFFRPVVHLVFAAMFAVFDAVPPPFHIANLVTNALCATLLAHLTYLLTTKRWTAWLAGALFVVIPTYSEVLVWVSAITEPINTIFFLLALIAWYHFLCGPRRPVLKFALALLAVLAALGSKESSVVLLPMMVLLHLGLRITGRARRVSPWIYLPLALLLAGYLLFQYRIQQQSYLVKSGIYDIGLHGVVVMGLSVWHVLQDAWPPLAAALIGAFITRIHWPSVGARIPLALVLAGALITSLLPYAMFGSGHLPSRYFYLSSMVMALAGAMLLAVIKGRGKVAGWVLATVALAGMLVNSYRVSVGEVERYTKVAEETSQFIAGTMDLPSLDTPIIIIDGRLQGQHLVGAVRLFRTNHPIVRFFSMKRSHLPPRWRRGSVWRWDRQTLKFREILPPKPKRK